MSRCFPFPPPGYTRNGSRSDDALIQSIKLQMEMEKAKKDRKEKKNEKAKKDRKEKKNEKKEKQEKREEKKKRKELKKAEKEKKRKESTTFHSDGAVKKLKTSHSNDTTKETKADGMLQKVVETELAERSVITEEHGPAAVSSQEPCTSDSSQNSKRKRDSLLPSQNQCEKVPTFRIRIPLRKHKEPDESKQVFQLGSSSGNGNVGAADSFTQDIRRSDSQLQCTTNVETNQFTGKIDSRNCNPLQNPVLDSRHCNPLQNPVLDSQNCNPLQNPVANNAVDDESRRMVSLYNSLFQIQIPSLTDAGLDSADQDWLFSSTKLTKAKQISMKPKHNSDAFQCSKSLGPRAQYLPEVEIYALPYTVPF